jgi:hypothetical protein
MKKLILAPLIGAFLASAANAAAPAKSPAGLDTMRQAFVAALVKKDVAAAVKLTNFPLAIVVYQQPPNESQKDFRDDVVGPMYQDKDIQHCIAHDPLTLTSAKDASDKRLIGAWQAECDGNDYYFAQKKGVWLFIGYENVNE